MPDRIDGDVGGPGDPVGQQQVDATMAEILATYPEDHSPFCPRSCDHPCHGPVPSECDDINHGAWHGCPTCEGWPESTRSPEQEGDKPT